MKIILFDMDGVLLHSLGYHRALQQTVKLVGEAMGYADIELTDEHIAAFESHGITCEWYSGAMCTAYLYIQAVNAGYNGPYPTHLTDKPIFSLNHHLLPEPLFEALGAVPIEGHTQLERVIKAYQQISAGYDLHDDGFSAILQESENPNRSLTFRIFQELVLGSQQFQKTYSIPPVLDTESYLSIHDIPLITPAQRDALKHWLQSHGNHAAILTNRPSLQIPGTASTPEAEIGLRLVGLGDVPIIGFGEAKWLAEQIGTTGNRVSKPSPIHALGAMQAAVGVTADTSMRRANELVNGHGNVDDWIQFKDAEVYIFEDTVGGLISLKKAAENLKSNGVELIVHIAGISPSPLKQGPLISYGAQVFNGINQALEELIKLG